MIRTVPRRRAAALLVALVGLLLLLPAAPASPHAVLVASDPADGARVETAPAAVRLTFDEAVTVPPRAATVLSSTGVRVDRGPVRLDGRVLVVPLRASVPAGVYSVSWRVVSADSHVVAGSIRFGVRRDATAVEGPVTTASPLDPASAAAAGLLYLAVSLGLGAPAAATAFWPSVRRGRRVGRLAAAGLITAAVATVAELLLRGPEAGGSGWAGVLALQDLGATLASGPGLVLLARLVLLGALAVLLRRALLVPAGVAGVGVLVTVALLGHASDGAAWLLVPAAVLHLAAMAVWLGGLAVLVAVVLPRLRGTPGAALRAMRRWSLWAFVCIGVLVVTGEVQAFPIVVPLPSLWSTGGGRLLLLKLVLVALLLVVAAALQRRVAAGRAAPHSRLRRAVAVEVVGVLAVLGVTGVLTGSATAAETYGPAVQRTTPIGADRLVVDVDRTRRGAAVIRVRAEDGGAPVRLESLSGTLSTPDVAALDVAFRRDGAGWRSTDATLPVPGTWTLTLDAERSATTAYAAEVSWPVW
ncbi:copper resistance protein CopC [Amnibacterium kyonggiense]|uniref:Copper transport protein n=1 Tax=Amnibacterium kyonggiense TaxID=595671 RepID=A0A4R7FRU9_9MICO|nr:copper resistance protein CopC [Amnibacterium kyonggiense]TDS80486.1 copper transport protein [Amnibacterium kyonggiense]